MTENRCFFNFAMIKYEFSVWFPNFEDMSWNDGGWGIGYVIVLIKSGLKIKCGWFVTMNYKKVIKVGTSKKIKTFSFKAHFVHFLVKG